MKSSIKNSCPVAETAKLIGDTATLLIIKCLISGDKRYRDIHEYVSMVSEVTLSSRLKSLQKTGFITRTQHQEIPPRVVYALTIKGRALKPVITSMENFGNQYC